MIPEGWSMKYQPPGAWRPGDVPDDDEILAAIFAEPRNSPQSMELHNRTNRLAGILLPWGVLAFTAYFYPAWNAVRGEDPLGWWFIWTTWVPVLALMLTLETIFARPVARLWSDGRIFIRNPVWTYETVVANFEQPVEKNLFNYPRVQLREGASVKRITVMSLQESEFQERWLAGSAGLRILRIAVGAHQQHRPTAQVGITRTRPSFRFWALLLAWVVALLAGFPW